MNPHFVEILRAFRDAGVEHLVIGAHALAAHGHVRATLDIDLWVRPSLDNAARTWRALERFRAPLSKMKLADFVAMQEGKLNGQEAFMTGRLRIEGDMAFMMQVAALTA